MPKMGDAMEAGTLLAWKVKDGDKVKAGDVIAEIETDKSNVEIEAEEEGVFHVSVAEGTSVPVGDTIATIGDAAKTVAPAPAAEAKPAAPAPAAPKVETSAWKPPRAAQPAPAAPAAGPEAERVKASPLARKIAREKGVDIAQVKGSGPNGRILEADVELFAAGSAPAKPAPAPKPVAVAPAPKPAAPQPPVEGEVIEPTQIRKVIARRMVESKSQIPHFYLTMEVDVEEIMALREKLNSYDPSLPKISLNDMILKASGKALAKFPEVNGAFRDGKIIRPSGQHVGFAVALDDGLIVPVVKNASTLPLRQIATTTKELIGKARDKKLQPSEYSGGTFTVSNLGGFDVDNFIAIIDPAQGAIMAVATIVKKPVVLDDDSIVVRRRMNLTLSGDHRIMDGATGAKFMQEVKRLVQNPLSLME
jgi:pyruvate dehydrogenase E2 component (dihydrolipoamide acetyltransferase)